jgi:two-component system, chemotaxis family, response regulator PixG
METEVDTDMTVMTKLFYDLKMIQARQGTGKLVIRLNKQSNEVWHIYFYLGRITWSTGGKHRVRRWVRSLREHCPRLLDAEWSQKTAAIIASREEDNEHWEVQVIEQAVKAGEITAAQAKAVVYNHIQEVFFSFIDQPKVESDWVALKQMPQQFVWLYVDKVVQQSSQLCGQWREALLGDLKGLPLDLSPDLSPIIKSPHQLQERVSPGAYQVLIKRLNGKNTFWDVALKMQKPLIPVVRSLLPLICEGIVGLQEVEDFSLPTSSQWVQALQTETSSIFAVTPERVVAKGLIACIDDSPLVGKVLEEILKPLGYEVLSILDPLQGVSTLLKRKPKLIFLDLVMPNTNGYELCSFLRKSTAFKDIPIVMLTGHDGVLDRLRAKVAGSTDFLSKPPDTTKVLQVVHKLLDEETSSKSSSANSAAKG